LSARRPSGRAKLLVAFVGPLVFFGLLEAGLRIGGYRFEPWAAYEAEAPFDELMEGEIYAPDPELLWTLRPSTIVDVPPAGFRKVATNADGLRVPEIPVARLPGEIRVLCLGDSVTFGLGLYRGDTWPDRLAEELRERAPGRPVRVVNAGVPGWSSYQGMRLLQRLRARGVDPDVIVFWFGMNDAKPARDFPDSEQRPPGESGRKALALLRRSRVFHLVQQLVAGTRRGISSTTRVTREEFAETVRELRRWEREGGPSVIFVRTPERMETTIAELEQVVARAESVGARIVVGPLQTVSWISPARDRADLTGQVFVQSGDRVLVLSGDRWQTQRLRLDELRRNLDMLRKYREDLHRILSVLPPERVGAPELLGDADPHLVFMDNCHLTPEGSTLAGRVLAGLILRRLADRSEARPRGAAGPSPTPSPR
jgi:lysophospholipase L1-like esterase